MLLQIREYVLQRVFRGAMAPRVTKAENKERMLRLWPLSETRGGDYFSNRHDFPKRCDQALATSENLSPDGTRTVYLSTRITTYCNCMQRTGSIFLNVAAAL